MKVSIVGAGYVGIVTGACLAERGHQVTCVDVDRDRVAALISGSCPIFEEGLAELIQRNVGAHLHATTDVKRAVLESDITLIAVGTPFDGADIDLSFIKSAAHAIGEALAHKSSYHVVAVKSTVVPGTTEDCVLPLLEHFSGRQAGRDFGVGMNPEFLREGTAVADCMMPDRIVVGGLDERTIDCLASLYSVFPGVEIVRTSTKTAEMIKYASNAFLATVISFSNEIGNLCSALGGIDVVDVMQGVHLDRRLSTVMPEGGRVQAAITSYLEAGCGFGGSCFPKDVRALIAHGQKVGQPMRLLRSVMGVNRKQPQRILELLHAHIPDVRSVNVAVLGLAFKPGTDDMRESPAIPIVQLLLRQGALVRAYDPAARQAAERIFGNGQIQYYDSVDQAVEQAEAVVVLTRWPEFQRLPALLSGRNPQPLLIDGRRMLPPNSVARYAGIGTSGAAS